MLDMEKVEKHLENMGLAVSRLRRAVNSRALLAVQCACRTLREMVAYSPIDGMPGQHVIDTIFDLEGRAKDSFDDQDRAYYLAIVDCIEKQLELAEQTLL